jgi:phenylacetic acid degradation operon negative regulatory protein
MVFHAEAVTASSLLAGLWDLRTLRDGYNRFISLFSGVDVASLTDAEALVMRLLLVHGYRMVLLRDPRLPAEQLPTGWNGTEARALFRRLYGALTPAAHRHVATQCEGVEGLLPAETEETSRRLSAVLSDVC